MPEVPATLLSNRRRAILAAKIGLPALVLLVVLRLIWGSIAHHRLDAALAAAGTSGDPLTPVALYPQTDPDPAHNAVPLFLDAIAARDSTVWSPAQSNLTYNDYPPYPLAWHQAADGAVANNAQTLKLARAARAKTSFYWKTPLSTLIANQSALNNTRDLANLLGDAALHAQIHGNDIEAVDRVRDLLHLSRAVDHQNTFVAYLVAIGIHAVADARLEVIAPALKITPSDEGDPLRQRLRGLIAQFLDDNEQVQSTRRAFVAERVFMIEAVRAQGRERPLLEPMYALDLVGALKEFDALLRASAVPHFAMVQAQLPRSTWPPAPVVAGRLMGKERNPPRFARPFSTNLYLDRALLSAMRVRMERHMLAVSLSAQLYRADHAGQWPPSLEALVPAYLPSVPVDPLAPQGVKLRYLLIKNGRPDGTDRPLVQSVGPDGVDSSVVRSAIPTTPTFGWNRLSTDDQFCDLSLWSPPPPSTMQSQ